VNALVLHHAPGCALSQAVRIALAEKGIEHELRALDVARFEHLDPSFLALNPTSQLPALETRNAVLTEAFFILVWLDESLGGPSLGGADPAARYRVQYVGKLAEGAIAPNLALLEWAAAPGPVPSKEQLMRLPPERQALWRKAATGFSDEDLAGARAGLDRALADCEQWLADNAFLAGDAFTLADILLYPLLARIGDLGPATAAWRARIAARPSAALVAEGTPVVTMGPERGRWG
jgi:glutathione S-transferase